MAKLLNKMLNLVGWEAEEEDEEFDDEETEGMHDDVRGSSYQTPQYSQSFAKKSQQGKVVNIHSNNQFKVVIMQPETFDDAREICDHLKSKKPVIVNLESISKETAQRIVDFLSGSVYALDGDIQKVSANIFLIAPNNVDIMSVLKDDIKGKVAFPWLMKY